MKHTVNAAVLLLCLAACAKDHAKAAAPEPAVTTLLEANREAAVLAPNASMRLVSKGDGEVLISAGFFNRNAIARINLPSRALWAPNSERLFINDSGSTSWSSFRLFKVAANGVAEEDDTIRRAAITELGRLSGCADVPAPDATTEGMAWAADGRQVYVLAQARRETGGCHWGAVEDIVVVADVRTGRLLETVQGGEARRRFPNLPWAQL